jgi:oligoendopeptidase F
LKKKIEKIGLEEYQKILEQFPNIKNTVPTLDELEDYDVKNPFIIDNIED